MGVKRLFALCFILAMSACSVTNPPYHNETANNKEPGSNSNQDTRAYSDDNPPNSLVFKKQETGLHALKAAIEAAPNLQFHQRDLSGETAEFVDDNLEFVRYTFGNNNAIYVADFKNSLMFDHDKAKVRRNDKQLIDNFAKLYRDGRFGRYLYIIGHTDSDGSASYNYALSARRARAVASLLLFNGFPESEISLVPAGEYLPKASNKNGSGKQLNRRVEVLSANSRALIQAYLRQLECPADEACSRKLLNVYDVIRNGQNVEMSLRTTQSFATFSPELNSLVKLDNVLRSGSDSTENQLLSSDDRVGLIQMGEARQAFTIAVDVRPVFRIKNDVRWFRIPKDYIIQ